MSDPELEPGPRWDGDKKPRPFQVVVHTPEVKPEQATDSSDDSVVETSDEMFSLEEIELAYLRALETADLADVAALDAIASAIENGGVSDEPPALEASSVNEVDHQLLDDGPTDVSHDVVVQTEMDVPAAAAEQIPVSSAAPQAAVATVFPPAEMAEELISATQVLEALLFVGGEPLPTKKLLEVLTGSTTPEQLDAMLMELNSQYLAEGRPYEIRLQSGGYVMHLREEFESIRSRAFGQGPKEVKLAQDALEVLAMIAYRQPVGRQEIEETGKANVGPILRQLLRRQLVVLERLQGEDVAQYRTTSRFLTLFGLRSLDDLPQAGDFNFK